MSRQQLLLLGLAVLAVFLLVPSIVNINIFGGNTDSAEVAVEPERTEAEVYADMAKDGYEYLKGEVQQKKYNDSLKRASKEKVWAYQIGFPVSDEKDLQSVYESLYNAQDIFIFKDSKNNYYLVYHADRSKEELESYLDEFKERISGNPEIKIIDLMNLCKLKHRVVKSGSVKIKKKVELDCLVCD